MKRRGENRDFGRRFVRRLATIAVLFCLGGAAILARAVQLQLLDQEFLARQGDARHLRVASIAAHRGMITDRNGEPLAVSTPVDSLWANPDELLSETERMPELAEALGWSRDRLLELVTRNSDREFVYLVRHMPPHRAAQVLALDIPGVYSRREYRRYYPAGEVTGHVVGFTNVDDQGLEGLELAYDPWLAGKPGAKRVLRDRLGRTIEDVESIQAPSPGRDLRTSLDLRLQYMAYRALKKAVTRHAAKGGAVVVLDVGTGEVLAMANQPGFNPNDRRRYDVSRFRNQAATDIFEPGSTIKPFVVAAALESRKYRADSVLDTSPGYIVVGAKTIEDKHNLGRISLTTVLTKSSNVGASRIALSLEPAQLWSVLDAFGIGQLTASGFPGESAGLLTHFERWREIGQATLAYGYGLSVTPLQLAKAFAILGSDGLSRPVTLVATDGVPEAETRVISAQTAHDVIGMLETVVAPGGTATRAAVPGYRIAGKTGTARKATAGGYSEKLYTAVFGGLAPASRPRLAAVVVIHEPSDGAYYGGEVAAPVFAEVVAGSLRILGIPPDQASGHGSGDGAIQAMRRP
ncbi:MAG: penicillin-binding transpeptidase domain-containing protein [Gammaproteobacteria bacterium]|jgi:cell division protein FtsI (penicillin-binding protein 3)